MTSRIAKLLSFTRALFNGAKVTDVTIDLGGGNNKTAHHFSSPGDDSFPLKTDYLLTSSVPGSGKEVVHGYIDPVNDPVAQEGDKRIYGRDPNTGNVVNQVWLQSDGSIVISNSNGSILMQVDGTVNINGVTIDPSGTVIADTVDVATSLTIDSIEMKTHTHTQANDSSGDSQVPTGPPV